jgi:cell division septation protein DedD
MKKFALLTILSLSSLLSAQEVIKYEIEPTIGYNSFDGNSYMESTFLYGIRGTIHPNSYYGYRLSYERSDDLHYDSTSTKKTTDLQRLSGQILINGEKEYNVIPYILVGGGYEILSDETKHDVSQAYVEGGIGFKYHMQNNLIFDLEAKALKKFDTDDIDYMVNFGLGYMFHPSLNVYKSRQASVLDEKPVTIKPKSAAVKKKSQIIKPIPVKKEIETLYTFKEEVQKKKSKKILSVTSKKNNSTYSNYYVQMAVWYKKENERLLSKLENAGYLFEIRDAKRLNKDVQLVLVGPYKNSRDAKKAYKKLRKIKKDAFITKM